MIFKNTHREKNPSNETLALKKGMYMDIWVVATSKKLSKKIKQLLVKLRSL